MNITTVVGLQDAGPGYWNRDSWPGIEKNIKRSVPIEVQRCGCKFIKWFPWKGME